MPLELSVTLDPDELRGALDSFAERLSALPEDAAKRVGDEVLRLLDGSTLNVAVLRDSAAAGAGDGVIRLRIAIGLDELIASACRAAEVDPTFFHGALR